MAGPASLASTWTLVSEGYASENLDHFRFYAREALDRMGLEPHHRLVDVATGPGPLALLAAPRCARVDALDFSQGMLDQLQRRIDATGVGNVVPRLGDGQELPYEDGCADRAASLFGLMFFPDRAAGFRELHRILKPGGVAAVSSWHPADQVKDFAALFDALFAEVPELAPDPATPRDPPPLSDPDVLRAEMGAAGFEVTVHAASRPFGRDTLADYVDAMCRSFVPLALLREARGASAFRPIRDGIYRRLEARFGPGPRYADMPAWIAIGRR